MKIEIKKGYTNKSYKDGDIFYQEKIMNPFNHKIDYSLLEKFSFVPKMISNSDKDSSWEWIEGQEVEINDETLEKVALIMKEIHNSKLPFPPSNHAARVKEYQRIMREKNIKIDIIDKYYKKINLILRNMDKTTPLHNDFYSRNVLVDKNNKLWVLDWEYASKGDKHFDLAYFIESSNLSDEQETTFLNAYDDYNYEFVLQHRIFVLYLTILWVNAQDVKPFDDKPFYSKIEDLIVILENRKKGN